MAATGVAAGGSHYGEPVGDSLPYDVRWGIEEYFRLLNSGTRIEDRRL